MAFRRCRLVIFVCHDLLVGRGRGTALTGYSFLALPFVLLGDFDLSTISLEEEALLLIDPIPVNRLRSPL